VAGRTGSLFAGSLWVSRRTQMSFCFEGFYNLFSFFRCSAFTFTFTFHTSLSFIESLFREMGMTVNTIIIIIIINNIFCDSNRILKVSAAAAVS
jgi:hypothetical protein